MAATGPMILLWQGRVASPHERKKQDASGCLPHYSRVDSSVMRIFLANQDPMTRSSLGILFRAQPDLELVGAAADASHSVSEVSASDPDVVLLDFDPVAELSEQLLGAIKSLEHPPAVVGMSVHAERRQDVLDAGADAFACKRESPDQLLSSIRSVEAVRNKKPRWDGEEG